MDKRTVIEDEAYPEVVHENGETGHDGHNTPWSTEFIPSERSERRKVQLWTDRTYSVCLSSSSSRFLPSAVGVTTLETVVQVLTLRWRMPFSAPAMVRRDSSVDREWESSESDEAGRGRVNKYTNRTTPPISPWPRIQFDTSPSTGPFRRGLLSNKYISSLLNPIGPIPEAFDASNQRVAHVYAVEAPTRHSPGGPVAIRLGRRFEPLDGLKPCCCSPRRPHLSLPLHHPNRHHCDHRVL